MTITVEQLSDPPNSDEDGVGLEVVNTFSGYDVPLSNIDWSEMRRAATDVSFTGIVQLTNAPSMNVRPKGGGDAIITGIVSGDYLAYDSYVVWHIPQADLAGLDVVIEGQTPSTVDMDPPIDAQ